MIYNPLMDKSLRKRIVFDYVANYPHTTAVEIAPRVGLSVGYTRRLLAELAADGRVAWTPSRGGRAYVDARLLQ